MSIPVPELGVTEALSREMFRIFTVLAPTIGMRGRFVSYDENGGDDKLLVNAMFSSLIQRGLIVPGPNLIPDHHELVAAQVGAELVRTVLEAICRRDGISLESTVTPGEPARNYELADRLRIGEVFGLKEVESDTAGT